MLTYVPIANLALQHIGEDDRIDDPNESSRPARIVKNAWLPTFLFILSEANWSFAKQTIDLVKRATDVDFPIARGRVAYPLPADMVRFIEIIEPELDDDDDSYSIEAGPNGLEIQCDDQGTTPLTVSLIRNLAPWQDPTRWPPPFVKAFAFELAWQISDPLSADKGRKDRARASADKAISAAERANNRTKGRMKQLPTDWNRARRGAGFARAPGTSW